jgi:hypothetical protein
VSSANHGEDDDLTSGIFPETGYEPGQPLRREFQPWHRPRKQFVRREQWSALLKRLYTDRPPADPVRYLGLPGVDLIDVRYLYEELCRPSDRNLRFLGFNTDAKPGTNAQIELSLSLDEVRRLPYVDPLSDVLPDDFRRLSTDTSIAWTRTLKLGPFDVVNIDLCDGVASDPPYLEESMYRALAQLAALQARNHAPWLLLITTRVARGMFDVAAEASLIDLFRAIVAQCPEGFVDACSQLLASDPMTIDPAACGEIDYLNLIIVALGQWLASLVQAHGVHKVELASTLGYRVDPSAPCEDLVSIAMRFTPIIAAPPDPFAPQPTVVDECETAIQVARRASARKDLDDLLAGDSELHEALVGETEVLLASARYDVTGYRAWLGANPSIGRRAR